MIMKNRIVKKGFTLIETIIVLAIFSIIMFGIIGLLDPVSKFFVRSSNYENTTACLDNMRRSIESNLRYADRIRAYAGYTAFEENGGTVQPTALLNAQVAEFHEAFFKNRVCFDASGTIYVLCFDNTIRRNDVALRSMSQLTEYNRNELNQGRILMFEYHYEFQKPAVGSEVYALDLNPVPTAWVVNPKLYQNFDYEFFLGTDNDVISTYPMPGTFTTSDEMEAYNATVVGNYQFTYNNCKIYIRTNEVRRQDGGLIRLTAGSSHQRTYASFVLENALIYTGNAYQNASKSDMKIIYEPTANEYQKVTIERATPLDSNPTPTTSNFYFIYTLPETCQNMDPTLWGIDPVLLSELP